MTPFEEKIIKNIMSGLGGTNMDNRGITYRERSPLVVLPSSICRPRDPPRCPRRTGRPILKKSSGGA
ncbi:MAG: hypothetical protein MZV49_21035 [Rhodopseudomonas palustris]|nr:hypothetical protein [Rhodopseudomonas palustris]